MISLVIGLILYLFSRIIAVDSLLGFICKFLGLYVCQKKCVSYWGDRIKSNQKVVSYLCWDTVNRISFPQGKLWIVLLTMFQKTPYARIAPVDNVFQDNLYCSSQISKLSVINCAMDDYFCPLAMCTASFNNLKAIQKGWNFQVVTIWFLHILWFKDVVSLGKVAFVTLIPLLKQFRINWCL